MIRDQFHAAQDDLQKFVPVVVPGQTRDGIPDFLTPSTSTVYEVTGFTVAGAEQLLRFLLGRPAVLAPELGPEPELPTWDPAAGKPDLLAGVDVLPADNRSFVGRGEELARLDAAAGTGRAVVVAVHGLGGVGKSTLAAHWAHANRERYTLVWWMTADSPAAIDTGLAALARAVRPDTVERGLEEQAEVARRWLASSDGWLLVLDNLSTPRDAEALLGQVRTGTVVITSRQATGWGRFASSVPLDVLPRRSRGSCCRVWSTRTGPGPTCPGPRSCARNSGTCPWRSSRRAPTSPRTASPRRLPRSAGPLPDEAVHRDRRRRRRPAHPGPRLASHPRPARHHPAIG
ncbi:AAA family ATPase [Actinokineospora soli]|uniref:AAA family ATPase n=1 Tax=Actinokineospora soli TaxID=1048753 RepID=A0ABW2TQY7_9PSEU